MDKSDYYTSYICVQLSMNTFKYFLKNEEKKNKIKQKHVLS